MPARKCCAEEQWKTEWESMSVSITLYIEQIEIAKQNICKNKNVNILQWKRFSPAFTGHMLANVKSHMIIHLKMAWYVWKEDETELWNDLL